jgi:signal transduction histidine kinase
MGKRPLLVMGFACLIAVFLGLCYAAHSHILGDDGKPVLWSEALTEYLAFWLGWGILAGPLSWMVYRFPISAAHRLHALYHFGASAVTSPIHATICYGAVKLFHVYAGATMFKSWYGWILMAYPRGIIYSLLIVAIVHALDYYQQYEEKALAASQLEAQLMQAKLHLLKMQLNPHFLFNTLNSISALLHEDVEMADLMIERLGDFLRLTLDHSTTQEVTLREELEFVNCYLSIEQIRLQDRLHSRIEAEPQTLDARVPNLILQPIVENAIRHGIAPLTAPGSLEIRARQEEGALHISVRDNGPGLTAAIRTGGTGRGLAITRARLEKLYGGAHRFELENAEGGGLVVTLEIPFHASIPQQVSA